MKNKITVGGNKHPRKPSSTEFMIFSILVIFRHPTPINTRFQFWHAYLMEPSPLKISFRIALASLSRTHSSKLCWRSRMLSAKTRPAITCNPKMKIIVLEAKLLSKKKKINFGDSLQDYHAASTA